MALGSAATSGNPQLENQKRKGLALLLGGRILQPQDDGAIRGRAIVIRTKRWKTVLRPFARKAVPIVDVGASIAEAVPILGATVKGSLDALVKTLKIIEQQFQNKEAIQQLMSKLQSLNEVLASSGSSSANLESLKARLEETERELTELSTASGLDHANVASSIAQCERDVTFFLGQFSAVCHIETQDLINSKNDDLLTGIGGVGLTVEAKLQELSLSVNSKLAEMQSELEKQRENTATTEERIAFWFSKVAAPGKNPLPQYITVIDPFGLEHQLMQIPDTRQELGLLILDRYRRSPRMWDKLARFVNANELDLSIDDYRHPKSLGKDNLGAVDLDSTIVMSAVLCLGFDESPWCPICGAIVPMEDGIIDETAYVSTERTMCGTCDRGVQMVPFWKHQTADEEFVEFMQNPNRKVYGLEQKDVDDLWQVVIWPVRALFGPMMYQTREECEEALRQQPPAMYFHAHDVVDDDSD